MDVIELPKEKNEPVYQTESELKAEALRKRAEQAKIDALKKPPSAKQVKADNFWYHYKWHTIVGIAALCLLSFFVGDMVLREKPDATIELVTSGYVAGDTIEALQAALSEQLPDRNGDGKVYIAVDFIQLDASVTSPEPAGSAADAASDTAFAPPPMGGGEAEYASVMKFSAVLASNSDPLFLVDDAVYGYIQRMGTNEDGSVSPVFAPQAELPAAEEDRLPLSATALADIPGLNQLDGLTFCLRINSKTGEKDIAYYNYCEELLKALAA